VRLCGTELPRQQRPADCRSAPKNATPPGATRAARYWIGILQVVRRLRQITAYTVPVPVPDVTSTNIIVFGRGLIRYGADYRLTNSSAARVDTLLAYIDQNKEIFSGRRGNVVFSGGWAGAGQGLERPPEHFREGALMLERATCADIGGHRLSEYATARSEVESDSTLENVLQIREAGYFRSVTFTACNPLGLIAQRKHLNRIDYLTRKVFHLPRHAVIHIVAPGADKTSSRIPEDLILLVTRLIFIRARSVNTLRRRQRILVFLNRALP
jgi:hypothetical protein